MGHLYFISKISFSFCIEEPLVFPSKNMRLEPFSGSEMEYWRNTFYILYIVAWCFGCLDFRLANPVVTSRFGGNISHKLENKIRIFKFKLLLFSSSGVIYIIKWISDWSLSLMIEFVFDRPGSFPIFQNIDLWWCSLHPKKQWQKLNAKYLARGPYQRTSQIHDQYGWS